MVASGGHVPLLPPPLGPALSLFSIPSASVRHVTACRCPNFFIFNGICSQLSISGNENSSQTTDVSKLIFDPRKFTLR